MSITVSLAKNGSLISGLLYMLVGGEELQAPVKSDREHSRFRTAKCRDESVNTIFFIDCLPVQNKAIIRHKRRFRRYGGKSVRDLPNRKG